MTNKRRSVVLFLSMLLVIILVAITTIAGFVLWNHTVNNVVQIPTIPPATPMPTATPTPSFMTMDGNVRLIISKIGLDAQVESVGRDNMGRMGVPTQNPWFGVGWYKHGPRPGERGSAVIDGHLDQPGGIPAIFWQLKELEVNDIVMLQHNKRHTLRFRVIRTQVYHINDAPLEKIFGDTSGHYLNLITCAGTWLQAEQQPSHRLVVFTELID